MQQVVDLSNMTLSDFVFANTHELNFVFTFMSIVCLLAVHPLHQEAPKRFKQVKSWVHNVLLGLSNFYLFAFLVPALSETLYPLVQQAISWSPPLNATSLPWYWMIIPGLLLFEFLGYTTHRIAHGIKFLWRFHAVHHSDTDVNPTTAARQHPLGLLLGALLSLPIYASLGVPLMVAMWYPLVLAIHQAFSHCHWLLPDAINKKLQYIIVTPNYHQVHHASDKQYTDSNYATMFTLFDHLLGTAKYLTRAELRDMEQGLEYWRESKDQRYVSMLMAPFRPLP